MSIKILSAHSVADALLWKSKLDDLIEYEKGTVANVNFIKYLFLLIAT